MNRNEVPSDFVEALLGSPGWGKAGVAVKREEKEVVTEEKEQKEEVVEETEEVEEHICPLCESTLEEELSEEAIVEFTSDVLDVLEEAEEALEESEDDEYDEDEQRLEK